MICKNCGHNFEGNFCDNCGQSSTVSRIDFKFLIHEIPNSIFQLDRGLLYTIKELSIKPGHSIRDFINGKRKSFYKPVAYFIILSAIYVLVAHFIGRRTFVADIVTGIMESIEEHEPSSGVEIFNWIIRNQTYISLLFVPIYSLASYLAFIKFKYNYFEHLVLNLYIKGQQMLIYSIFGLVITKNMLLTSLPVLMSIAYNIWSYFQFFDKKKNLARMLLIVLVYFLLILISLVLLILIGFVIGAYR